ncbi:hypothetical protein [Nocardia fluminea]|uniref:hypothetical protein n=1 Tax=Nocardia fluminea TaxID=134984 RepID=UPI000C706ADD|nr:hypothetical protein [Nocardia fluminea]
MDGTEITTPPDEPRSDERTGDPTQPGTPASRYCARHPLGTPDDCGQCAESRKAVIAAELAAVKARRAEGLARATALAECPHCDQNGYRVEPNRFYALTIAAARCDHTAWSDADWDAHVSTESSEARQAAARAQPWAFG